MASFVQDTFIFTLFIFISLSTAQSSSPPKSLLLPISKDPSTLQYLTKLGIGTPLVQTTFVLDLGGENLWLNCETGYKSSTYKPGRCGSAPCAVAHANGCFNCKGPSRAGCTKNSTCSLAPENTVTQTVEFEELAMDTISLLSTDGSKAGPPITIPNFIFACGLNRLLTGLAKGAKGMAGLGWGRTRISLPKHISRAFGGSFPRKFALCLPSTTKSNGVLFFGNGSYVFYPHYNVSKHLDIMYRFVYTKLYINPMSTASAYIKGEPSSEYFVKVTSILIDGKPIPVNTSLLSINEKGIGGTKFSTVNPYTVLESSIYKVVTEAFAKELKAQNVSKVAAVAPFTECFSSEFIPYTQYGPVVPDIAFVFEKKDVFWGLDGFNLMVEVSRDVLCLGLINGGSRPRTTVVIGTRQMEDNLLEFDLAASRVGFNNGLIMEESGCANFNF